MKYSIIFGANSYEHEISIVSAITLKKVIKSELVFIFCDQFREFYLIESENMIASYFSKGDYKKAQKLILKNGGFFAKKFLGKEKVDFDVCINIIHGADGEDGKIAALFDFYRIPYIGPRIEASVMSYNKAFTKLYARECEVKTLESLVLRKGDEKSKIDFPLPIILKPARLGSSVGIEIVKSEEELDYKLDEAFSYDDEIVVEKFISGVREFNLAGCKVKDAWKFSIIEEPNKVDFLDYEQKYMAFSEEKKVAEADLTEDEVQAFKTAFKKIYNDKFEGSLIRCDFFLIDGEVYLNEINPNPGSLANYLFKDFNAVLDELSKNLPQNKMIKIDYSYIEKISSNK